ncbi:MAG: PKD domain-containing protein [Bacteroidia bacterium]|nr:PKD domain-containing protein [Bacteroidia bacterium]
MRRSSKILVILSGILMNALVSFAQIDTCFWFAAPWVTPDHWWKDNVVLHISTFNSPNTTVRIRQPALAGYHRYDTTINISANSNFDYILYRHKLAGPTALGFDSLETRPANTVVPYGLYISSTDNITVVYDVVTRPTSFLNPETMSLKGQNALGTEFVCPFQTKWKNQTFTNNRCGYNGEDLNCDGIVTQPKQQINIVATMSNTVVWITPKCPVIGHSAATSYSILLSNPGDAYTIENATQFTNVSGQNLSGTTIVSNHPIAVTVADDSVSGYTGCFDLMGDQIVPVDIVGKDYIVVKGAMNTGEPEGAFVVATENFTQLTINDGVITNTLMNKGDTYHYQTTQLLTSIIADKNVYVLQGTGFGCELGEALLPPLSCAGSSLVAFSRNNNQPFRLNILAKAGTESSFTLSPSAAIPASSFAPVPGFPGYVGAQIVYSTLQIPSGFSYTVGNSADVFALGVFNGDLTTGGLYHYMSSFLRRTTVKTQTVSPICAGQEGTVAVTGTISGADITGVWSTSYNNGTVTINGGGSGTFSPVYSSSLNVISTIYTVSVNDTSASAPTKTITLYLSSTGSCRSVVDSIKLVINQRPQVSVSTGTVMCKNNVLPVILSGTVTNAVSGQWGGGNGGVFGVPGLVTTYTPSSADLAANTITLSLTSQAPLAGCPNTVKSLTVAFIDPPVVSIVPNNTVVCTNSTTLALNGNITGITTTGTWLGGTGAYTLTNASPSTTYILSPGDLSQTSITLTLTSTNNSICAAESSTLLINVIPKPTVLVPPDFTVCASAGTIALTGTVSGSAVQGVWTTTNGAGFFSNNAPQISPVDVTYFMNQLDTADIYFTLESSGGVCPADSAFFKVSVLSAPVVKVNENFLPVCRNALIALTGTVSGYTSTGLWSTSSNTSSPGTFTPGPAFLNGYYQPSESDISNGFVELTLTSTNNQGCPASSAMFTASFVPSPKARFNFSLKRCMNAPVLFQDASEANGTDFLKWNWDFGDNSPTGGSASSNPIKTYTNAGQYVVTLTVTGVSLLNVSCPDIFDTIIRIKPLPIADFEVSPACQDQPVIFNDLSIAPPGSDRIMQWKWEFGDSANAAPLITGIPTKTVSHKYPTPERFSAILTVTAAAAGLSPSLGCVSDPKRIYVDVFPKPEAEFGMTNNPSVVQEPVYFTDFSTPTSNIAAWFWDFGDSGASTDQGPSHIYDKAGIFSIKLTVIDKAGCVDTIRKDIDVTLLPQVPGGFTPNNDGLNDLLLVKGGPFERIVFRVYNSWGELVFETNDQKEGWDGRKNGIDQPVGVYVWTLVVDMYNNRQVRKNGDISLIR